MATLNSFMKHVLPHVTGCPTPVAEQAVLDSAIHFCEETRCHRKELDAIDVADEVNQYTPTLPTDTVIESILYAAIDGTEISRRTRTQMENELSKWRTVEGAPKYVVMDDIRTVRLVPIPQSDYILTLEVYLKPASTATTIDDYIAEEFYEGIAAGALARLFKMPKKGWSSQPQALLNAGVFQAAMDKATVRNDSGYVRSKRKVKYGGL